MSEDNVIMNRSLIKKAAKLLNESANEIEGLKATIVEMEKENSGLQEQVKELTAENAELREIIAKDTVQICEMALSIAGVKPK